jgi:hypothetical protein
MTPRQVREAKAKRSKAYQEFEEQAIRLISSEVIRFGFSRLDSLIEVLIDMYKEYEHNNPKVEE